jgi:hypothetical protein
MLGHPISLRLALQKIIPILISYTFSESQTVRGEPANHNLLQLCELIEDREVT